MKKIKLALISTLILSISVNAQDPVDRLNAWASKYPIEKVHLHMDRENYIAGETIWFKAYLYSDYLPDTISTSLFLELVIDSATTPLRKVLPVLFGTTNGHFDIPDSASTGWYTIRAWTTTMLNQDPGFIFKRSVFIYRTKPQQPAATPIQYRMEFFPEGGNIIGGVFNTVAFRSTDINGNSIPVKGKILNDKNETVTSFSTYHDGRGMFDLTPAMGEKFYALIDGDPTQEKRWLPLPTDKGIGLTVIPGEQGYFYEIQHSNPDPNFQGAYMIGQMQHHPVFRLQFKAGQSKLSGTIDTRKLPSGILQLTVFNRDGLPLAERICFVNNKEYIQPAELRMDTLAFLPRSRNHLSVKMKDTIRGSFSISVTDASYDLQPTRQHNIYSQFLLSSDLRGELNNPAWYFNAPGDSAKLALDLVMMTNGWRRFTWTQLSDKISKTQVPDPGFINLSGLATLRGVKKPFDEKPMILYITGGDSAQTILMLRTDKQGRFKVDSLLFFGKAKLLFSDTRGKKSQFIDVYLNADSLNKSFSLPGITNRSLSAEKFPSRFAGSLEVDYDYIQKEKGLLLEGITVKAKKKSPIEELEEKYVSGMFQGFSEKTLDLTKSKASDLLGYLTIFEYLRNEVPGIDFGMTDMNYVVYYRQGPSVSSMGSIPMTIYLNEVETDANVVATIAPTDIALVKVFSSFVGAVGSGAGGVLAIYTKKDDDGYGAANNMAARISYTGYSVIKEFYSPDYRVSSPEHPKVDQRITLQWKPDIMVSGIDQTIPLVFYNNDRTKKYRVVVEGMTIEGKMVMIEKIVGND